MLPIYGLQSLCASGSSQVLRETVCKLFAQDNLMYIKDVSISGRFSSDVSAKDGSIFALKAVVKGAILGKAFEYSLEFDIAQQEQLIIQLIEMYVIPSIIDFILANDVNLLCQPEE